MVAPVSASLPPTLVAVSLRCRAFHFFLRSKYFMAAYVGCTRAVPL